MIIIHFCYILESYCPLTVSICYEKNIKIPYLLLFTTTNDRKFCVPIVLTDIFVICSQNPHQYVGHKIYITRYAIKPLIFTPPITSSGQASRPYEIVPIGTISSPSEGGRKPQGDNH